MKKIILLLFVIFSSWQINAQVSIYGFSQSSGTYTPLIGGTVIATYTDATTDVGTMDDQVYNLPAATIPFTFTYDGLGYDGLNVNSNGFITFGTTPPAGSTYGPLNSTTAFAGAISAFGRDLEGGYVFTADRTTGSPDLVNVSNLGPAQVGSIIDGTGIPAGTTITAIVGSTITMSANATTTGAIGACRIGGTFSNIQYGVEGVAPNRVFVIQYSNFKRYGTTLTTVQHMTLNFQIRLSETSNAINIVYGNCSPGLTTFTTTNQVGLRGPNNTIGTNVNNRLNVKGISDWATSTPGTLNSSGQVFNNLAPANVIASGLTYTWLPPVPCTGTPTPGTVSPSALSICASSSPGNLVASGFSSGVSGLIFQWEQSTDGIAWVDSVGGTNANTSIYTPPAFSGNLIYYRLKVTCTNSSLFAYSTSTLISTANPNTQVTNANSTIVGSVNATLNWTIGNGGRRMVVLSNSPTIVEPVNGNAPALVGNLVYSGTGQQIMYDGTAAAANVSGLTQNTTYYVKVYEYLRCGTGPYDFYYNTTTGSNTVTFTTIASPLNDNCSGAVSLTVNPDFLCSSVTAGTVFGASASTQDAAACSGTEDDDVWFSFVATATSHRISILNAVGSTTDMYHSLWTGTDCNSLTLFTGSCSDPDVSNRTGLTIGQTYYVRVYTWTATAPQNTSFNICIGTPPPPPANDECLGAISLTVNPDSSCGTVTPGTIQSATASAVDATACSGTEDDDVWFSFVATSTTHSIALNNVVGSTTDLDHSLWTGGNCSSLTLVPGTCSSPNFSSPTGLVIGQTYYLRVYSFSATGGQSTTFNVCIGIPPPPPLNDNCSGAVSLTVGANFAANAVVGSNISATASQLADPTIPAPGCSSYSGGDVWYSVTVPSTGNIKLETSNSVGSTIADTGMVVYSGPCNALVTVLCDDDSSLNGNFSLITLTGRTPGEVLYIRVFEYLNDSFGQFQVSAYDCPSGTPAPTGAAAQSFCTSATVANLVTTSGTSIKWYTTATLGTALLPTDALVSGNMYYASQTTTPGCEGLARLMVTVTIDTVLPTTPTGAAAQTFCSANSPTLASLAVTGSGLVWYDAATLGNVLPSTTLLTATTYYAASSAGACVSSRLAITTTNICPVAPCFNGTLYPSVTFTPQTCNGLVQNSIRTDCWPGEYSNVNVTTGQTYIFGSSVSTDFITISVDGVTAIATGTGTVTWVSTITGTVRFYTHLAACGTSFDNRTRYVTCGIPSLALPDYVNLQFPATATIAQGGNVTVYGQVYEAGLTDVAPNIVGQASGIQAWVGISTTNSNPNTWTDWAPATWNSGNVGNNDEYQAIIGATLIPGTYYYATRFNLDGGVYVYGGINASTPNNGSFWNGTTFGSGVLTVSPPPAPANDLCSGAIPLTPGGVFQTNPLTGTVLGATTSTVALPACPAFVPPGNSDVWYSVVVPASGNITIETQSTTTNSMNDTLLVAFTGTCGTLTSIGCSDDDGIDFFSLLSLTGQVPGSTLYIGLWKYGTAPADGTNNGFRIAAYDVSLGNSSFDNTSFSYYPNPVKNMLNLSYSEEISNVEVYNLLGQRVRSIANNANEVQVDMSNLPRAAYIVKVTSNDQVKTIKVIKE